VSIVAPRPEPHEILNNDPDGWELYDVKPDGGKMQACFNYKRADYWQHSGPHCKYGQPGDRLWVKETFWTGGTKEETAYRADAEMPSSATKMGCKWKPSIFMPRKASRITLEIVNVRVERLQNITEEDANAEGIPSRMSVQTLTPAVADYAALWESINGYGSWTMNPWVWVIEFKKL
jgi:hypothetical protein